MAAADGDRVSAALWVDGGRCADARVRDASRALFPRSIFHGLRFASVSLKKIETDLLGSWWP